MATFSNMVYKGDVLSQFSQVLGYLVRVLFYAGNGRPEYLCEENTVSHANSLSCNLYLQDNYVESRPKSTDPKAE